jgi:hypothetical protein
MIAYDRSETTADPRAQGTRLMPQNVTQPVTALTEHVCQQPLDIAPVVVETLKEQLDVRCKLLVMIRSGQRLTRRPVVKLARPFGDQE